MRKKFFNGKRVLALALALSMVVSEAAFAAPADVTPEAIEAALETESVSANETVDEVPTEAPTDEADEVEAEDESAKEVAEGEETDEAAEEEELEAETAYDGTLSKVIGLEGSPEGRYFSDGKGNIIARYTEVNPSKSAFYVTGEIKEDPATGVYNYGGKTYLYASYEKATNETRIDPYYEIVVLQGTDKSKYLDAATGLYTVNGAYYTNLYSISKDVLYCRPSSQVVPVAVVDDLDYTAIRKQYGVYTTVPELDNPEDIYEDEPDYYMFNGKSYCNYINNSYRRCWNTRDVRIDNQDKTLIYAYASEEIVLNKQNAYFSWKGLTNPNVNRDELDTNSELFYEIMVNGEAYHYNYYTHGVDAAGEIHYLYSGTSKEINGKPLAPGESIKVKVRGVLAHYVNKQAADEDGTVYGRNVYAIDSYGDWSDEVTYTMAFETVVPKVSTVSASKLAGLNYDVMVKWNAVPTAAYYYVYVIDSKKPITVDASNFKKFYQRDSKTLTAAGIESSDLSVSVDEWLTEPEWRISYEKTKFETYNYHYYAVAVSGAADGNVNTNAFTDELDSIGAVAFYQSAPASEIKTPALTGVKLEKQTDGSFDLVWNKVDAKVVIYAYESKTFPANHQYKAFASNVTRTVKTADNGSETYSLYDDLYNGAYDAAVDAYTENTSKDYINYNKIISKPGIDGKAGKYGNIIGNFGLTAGKTYYFVAYTYDMSDNNTEKAPIVYTYPARYYKNGVATATTVTASYTKYPTMSAPSVIVSAKAKLSKPGVTTFSTPKSIKFDMSANGAAGTGYEIYRKEGKKYKKIATVTSGVYTDEGLKSGVTYNYKVRSYGYRPGTKKVYYSEYTFLTAKTFAAADLELTVTKASKTSAKLKWTKVPNATKYEVYRSDEFNGDAYTLSKKFSANGIKRSLNAEGYKLVKTLGAGAATYTDKKLTKDKFYRYVVVVTYKEGASTMVQYASCTTETRLEAPKNVKAELKGKKVTVTWDKDKFAAGYEVSYIVVNKYGNSKSTEPVKKTTKKASFTIKGLELGGTVSDLKVRAYTKKKEYSDYASPDYSATYVPLGAVKGISAKTVTTADGKEGVKISWKKVAGAKYYKVYRCEKEAVYDADAKLYRLNHWKVTERSISKDGNDDYVTYNNTSQDATQAKSLYNGDISGMNDVAYREYAGVWGSIVGTSAVDFSGDMMPGVTYYYTVQAFGDVPSGGSESEIHSIYCSKPAQVVAKTGLDFEATSKKGKVTLKWTKMVGAKGVKYTVYRSTKAKGKYTKIGTTKKTTFTDKKSKKGKTYYYQIEVTGTNALKADMNATSDAKKVKAK